MCSEEENLIQDFSAAFRVRENGSTRSRRALVQSSTHAMQLCET